MSDLSKVKSSFWPTKLRVKLARIASTVNLIVLFAAIALYALGQSTVNAVSVFSMLARVLHFVVIVSACTLLATGVYRIALGGGVDDFERKSAHKASYFSYYALGGFLILSLFAIDTWSAYSISSGLQEISVRQLQDTLGAMFWVAIDLVIVLPAAFLAWLLPIDTNDDE